MYRTATIMAYDVMETVHVTASVHLFDKAQIGTATTEFTVSVDIQGVGSAEGYEWLRDALVGLLEAL
jgi:hypothetical protein